MEFYPRVLVLSNECFSNSSSNGRTLRNFFVGWPVEKLAQFYIHGIDPDDQVCTQYYCVSDGNALRSFCSGKPANGRQRHEQTVNKSSADRHSIQRNAISMMARNLVWNSMRWAGSAFYDWVEEFSPEVILLLMGDSSFMLRLSRELARRYQIPLVIYNTEAYYFKKHDYFRSDGLAKAAYPLFHSFYCREFEKTIQVAACSAYCCDKLKKDHDRCFGRPSCVVYVGSELVPSNRKETIGSMRISYLGNLGVGRHTGLVEIGNALQEISQNLKLDVYGKIPNEEVRQALSNCNGICFHGFVSYEKVREVIADSDILIHTESFEAFYKEDLKYAFSTKIADSLASGRCFLLYAPENMACTEYLKENQAAWVVEKQEDLLPILQKLLEDDSCREKYVRIAQQLVRENHSVKKSVQMFQQLLQKCAKGAL